MESNQQRETHRQRLDDRGDVQAPAFLLPTVLASLGLDDADVQPPLTTDILLHALHDEDDKVRVWAVRGQAMSFSIFPQVAPGVGASCIKTMENGNPTSCIIGDDVRTTLCSRANRATPVP